MRNYDKFGQRLKYRWGDVIFVLFCVAAFLTFVGGLLYFVIKLLK